MKVEWRSFASNLCPHGLRQIRNSITDCSPRHGFRHVSAVIGELQSSLCATPTWVIVSFSWRKYELRINVPAAYDYGTTSILRDTVICRRKHPIPTLKSHFFCSTEDFTVLESAQELRYVFHDKDSGTGPLDDFEKWPPKLFPWIPFAVLVQEAETLTGWATDHNVCRRKRCIWIFQNVDNVTKHTMRTEISLVCTNRILIEVIGPYRLKGVTHQLRKAQGHTTSSGEGVNQTVSFALPREGPVHTSGVDPRILTDILIGGYLKIVLQS